MLFGQHGHKSSGQLEPDEVMNLLNACGCDEARSWLNSETLLSVIIKAKEYALRSARTSKETERYLPDSKLDQPEQETRERMPSITESREEEAQDKQPSKPEGVPVSFLEFLNVLRLVRRATRERRRSFLLEIFGRYDHDNTGIIAAKDMGKILRDMKVQPRTREQQLEMRRIFDEADESGEGVVAFPQFELLVQRVCEKIQRLTRHEEEHYALELGFQLQRFRSLRHLFECHVQEGTRLLYISGLRKIMIVLQRGYGSEELFSLFFSFSRPDLGAMEAKGFYRMMHAIEVAKTHGQL